MEDKGRLINASAAVIKISGKVTPILQKHGSKPRGIYLAVLEALAECPTVDAAEVVHGYWVATPVRKLNSKGKVVNYCDYYHCSECGTDRPIVPPYNYCPNCGAKMDGITDKC